MARKTPEEMALIQRIKLTRSMVRLKYSILADAELNILLDRIMDEHNHELSTGGLKELAPGTIEGFVKDVADLHDNIS